MDFPLLVSNIARHISLSEGEKQFFIALVRTRTLEAGEFLLREGDICKYQSFVLRGCLKAYYEDDAGEEHVVDFLIEDWWAEDLYSFLTQTPARSSIRALEDTDIAQISKNDLETLYRTIPSFERFFRLLFQRAYIAQRDQINMMLSAPAEERYAGFIRQKPYGLERFPQKDIASYLGVTPQFFSVLKKKFAEQESGR